MEQKQTKKLMLKAFKEGQETPDATEGIIKLWINSEFINNTNNSQQCKKSKDVPLQKLLEPRSKTGEDKKTVMPVDADNHSADSLTGNHGNTEYLKDS